MLDTTINDKIKNVYFMLLSFVVISSSHIFTLVIKREEVDRKKKEKEEKEKKEKEEKEKNLNNRK